MKSQLIVVALIIILLFAWFKLSPKTHEEEVFYTALENFTYQLEPTGEDTYLQYTHYDNPFIGDCEDFAFTLQRELGGQVWAVEHDGPIKHAVLIKDGIVYDNFHQQPIRVSEYPTEFIKALEFNGQVINN